MRYSYQSRGGGVCFRVSKVYKHCIWESKEYPVYKVSSFQGVLIRGVPLSTTHLGKFKMTARSKLTL